MCSSCEDSKVAITHYKVIAKSNGFSLVKATPVTGRTHQLRVHFSYLGAPILGDDLYGNSSPMIERHALHAHELYFLHPETQKEMELHAPIPFDMQSIIKKIFGKEFANL